MDITKIKAGKNPPSEINVFIEITQGSAVKYELDKESGVIVADRFLHTSMHYPFNYGFIPSTKAEDGDPVDVLLLSSAPLQPGTMIEARPIGMLEMEDEAGLDDKILAVPKVKIDPHYGDVNDISDLNGHTLDRVKHFFETYKELEPGKWVKVKGFFGKKEAEANIKKGLLKKK
ncbi:MAG: inorganic diphosphatase [Patescibacteria group bacterium]|nr:inorganic diphosphatase [Patescibacteria group bacterium]